jgi:hypothetical protein
MTYNFKDLTGQKFGILTVLRRAENSPSGKARWLCKCECGNECLVCTDELTNGNRKSCGHFYCEKRILQNKDFIGKIFGRLTVLEYAGFNSHRDPMWLCQCKCGNTKVVRQVSLLNGDTKSCGCLHREIIIERSTKHGLKRRKNGNKLYPVLMSMRSRCYNPNNAAYSHYGARGIIICPEWLGEQGIINFYNWSINNGYQEGLTIDRIDVNGNYEPNNCRWVDMKTQQNNRSNNHYIEIDGETHTIAEWAIIYNIPQHVIHNRIHRLNWDPIDAVTASVGLTNDDIPAFNYIMNSIDSNQEEENERAEEEYIQETYFSNCDIQDAINNINNEKDDTFGNVNWSE